MLLCYYCCIKVENHVNKKRKDALIESKVVNTARYESESWPGLIIASKERPLTWSWNLFRFKNPLSISSWRWTWNLWCWLSGPWAGPVYIIIKWTYCGKMLNSSHVMWGRHQCSRMKSSGHLNLNRSEVSILCPKFRWSLDCCYSIFVSRIN